MFYLLHFYRHVRQYANTCYKIFDFLTLCCLNLIICFLMANDKPTRSSRWFFSVKTATQSLFGLKLLSLYLEESAEIRSFFCHCCHLVF